MNSKYTNYIPILLTQINIIRERNNKSGGIRTDCFPIFPLGKLHIDFITFRSLYPQVGFQSLPD